MGTGRPGCRCFPHPGTGGATGLHGLFPNLEISINGEPAGVVLHLQSAHKRHQAGGGIETERGDRIGFADTGVEKRTVWCEMDVSTHGRARKIRRHERFILHFPQRYGRAVDAVGSDRSRMLVDAVEPVQGGMEDQVAWTGSGTSGDGGRRVTRPAGCCLASARRYPARRRLRATEGHRSRDPSGTHESPGFPTRKHGRARTCLTSRRGTKDDHPIGRPDALSFRQHENRVDLRFDQTLAQLRGHL